MTVNHKARPSEGGLRAAVAAAYFFGLCVLLDHVLWGPLSLGAATLAILGVSSLAASGVFVILGPLLFFLFPRVIAWLSSRAVGLWRLALWGLLVTFAAVALFASFDPSLTLLTSTLSLWFGASVSLVAALSWWLVRKSERPWGRLALWLCLGYAALFLWLASLLPPYNSQHQQYNALLLCFSLLSLAFGLILGATPHAATRRAYLLLGLLPVLIGSPLFLLRYRSDFHFRALAARGGRLSRTILRHAPLLLPPQSLQRLTARAAPASAAQLGSAPEPNQALLKALGAERPTNLVWVTVDTLRDDLGGATPPTFARLSQESVRFTSFYSTATSTRAALQGLFLGWVEWMREAAPSNLFEQFQRHGFQTMAVLSITTPMSDAWVQHGLDVLLYPTPEELGFSAERVNELFFHQLKTTEKPFLAWLHYIEPHAPYQGEGTPQERYAAEIEHVDQALGALLDGLTREGLLSQTMLVITADHGEEFLEHGGTFHSRAMFNETIKVPLWVRAPSGALTGELSSLFSSRYLGEVMLSFAGIASSEVLSTLGTKPIFSFRAPYVSSTRQGGSACVLFGRYKLIYDLLMRSAMLYDIEQDPTEEENLIEAQPEVAAALAALLDRELQQHGLSAD